MLLSASIKQNKFMNLVVQTAISASDCAAFSLDVYFKVDDPKRPAMPAGWSVFAESKDLASDYFGRCYIKHLASQPNKLLVVFAHRGKRFDEDKEFLSGFNKALRTIPEAFQDAKKFISETEQALVADRDSATIYRLQTGHSLGAMIAEMMSVGATITPTITFENPGSKSIMHKYLKQQNVNSDEINKIFFQLKRTSVTYLADINFINTCHEQVGNSWQLLDLSHHDVVEGKFPQIPNADYKLNPHYFSYSLCEHQMEKIYDYCKANGAVEYVQYPVGLWQGYSAYLNPARKAYWDEYITMIWNAHDRIRETYQSIEYYAPVFYLNLKQVYEDSLTKSVEQIMKISNTKLGLFKPFLKSGDINLAECFTFEKEPENQANSQGCSIM